MTSPDTEKIRALNDAFREKMTKLPGAWIWARQHLVVTSGVAERGNDFIARAAFAVRTFSDFTPDNDPWSEHDFGAFDLDGVRLNWKIDCYDPSLEWGSEDPADGTKTRRVLTILLAEEY